MSFFFTLGTVWWFGGAFVLLDAFLEFCFEGFLEEFSTFEEKELVHVIDGLWVTGNEIALFEEGFELSDEQVANGRGFGLHNNTSV